MMHSLRPSLSAKNTVIMMFKWQIPNFGGLMALVNPTSTTSRFNFSKNLQKLWLTKKKSRLALEL